MDNNRKVHCPGHDRGLGSDRSHSALIAVWAPPGILPRVIDLKSADISEHPPDPPCRYSLLPGCYRHSTPPVLPFWHKKLKRFLLSGHARTILFRIADTVPKVLEF